MKKNINKNYCFCLLFVLFAMQSNCGFTSVNKDEVPPKYKAFFFEMTPEQQAAAFDNSSVEDQIDYYVASFKYEHPGRAGYGEIIAKRHGKAAVTPLLKRIREEKYPAGKFDLMYVLEAIHRTSYNLKNDREVIETLRAEQSKMNERDKQTIERVLKYIEETPGYQGQS